MICPGCNGVMGRDCFNTEECQAIARDKAAMYDHPSEPGPWERHEQECTAGDDGLCNVHFSCPMIRGMLASLETEREDVADKLSDCWLIFDSMARGEYPCIGTMIEAAKSVLRNQKAPGWKDRV